LRFDRGTVVLERSVSGRAEGQGLDRFAGVLWDPRASCYRAPAFRHPELVRALRREGEGVLDEARRFGAVDAASWRPPELRPYQQAALGAWELGGRRGVLALPTGAGKTRVAIAAMARLGVASLVLVPTRVLLHQWRAELGRFFDGKVGAWGDGEREVAPIMVITFESAYRQMHRLGRAFELLVVDEVHHFGAGRRDEALEMSIAPYRLGLTATLPSDPSAVETLETLVGPVVFQRSVQQLAGRYLADFEVVVLNLPLDEEERAAYEADQALFRPVHAAFRRVAPGARWADFVAAVQESREGQRALAAWRRTRRLLAMTRAKAHAVGELLAQHRDRKVLVFTSDNEAAYAVARQSLVAPITCDIRRDERDEVLALFRSGELPALVSSRVLNEGIDVPDADVAIIAGGSHGDREYVQRVGRLLRPAQGKRACIYELVAANTSEAWQARQRRAALR
jgi:superfamily II DNA or RNA helicase